MNSVAWRLPKVIVPVLSSSKVSTSPAASTARPDIARTLKRTSRSMPAMPIADNKRADRRRDQADEQRGQHDDRHRAAGIGGKTRDRHRGEDKDQGHTGEQDVERDLIRRLLPHRPLDQGNHAVEKGRALRRGDANLQLIRCDPRAAGYRRSVAAAFANDGRRFAGDCRLVDRGDALNDLAVARDQVAGLDQHHITGFECGGVDEIERGRLRVLDTLCPDFGARTAQGVGLGLAAAFGHRLGEICKQHREPQPDGDLPGKQRVAADDLAAADKQVADKKQGGQHRDDLDAKHDRVFGQGARVELFK